MPDDFQLWNLPTRHLGQRVHIYDRLDSTNTLALSLGGDPNRHGLVIVAREQSGGRGQYGRTWHAPHGSSVLMSVLLFTPAELRQPAIMTAWAAVSVCETIQELTDLEADIKWPNDVLIDYKKVCGILIEQRTTGIADHPLATVVGIGLNVTQSAELFFMAGLPDAASLASISGLELTFDNVARKLVDHLDKNYHLIRDGAVDSLEERWRQRLGMVGMHVVVEDSQKRHHGVLIDLSFAGVEIELINGEKLRRPPEAVRRLQPI